MHMMGIDDRTLQFFDGKPYAMRLYQAFLDQLTDICPEAELRVQKTQITFVNPKVFACVSFAKVRKAKDRPKEYLVITLGLNRPVDSPRMDVVTEPYPGRWTHHLMITGEAEIDAELMAWVAEAYAFAKAK